jgi:hypothetical protein
MKLVCAWCERVIEGPIIGIEGGDEVAPLICKACFYDVFKEGDKTDVSKIYAAIQAKSGRYEN